MTVESLKLSFLNEPRGRWTPEAFDKLLVWASELGASDIKIRSGSPVWVARDGEFYCVTERRVGQDEPGALIDAYSRDKSASAHLKGGRDIDFSHEVTVNGDRSNRLRFRCNATPCLYGWSTGFSMTLRVIPAIPPRLEDLNVEQEILDSVIPDNGLILVTGVMGMGKSTLLSAILRHVNETTTKNIITYESPVEFNLSEIPGARGPVEQTAIPDHLPSFEVCPRNAARRTAKVILVGESRDPETLGKMIEASELGVAAYSTVHTRSVAATPSRIINVFESEDRNLIAATMISSLRVIIHQRLLPKLGGGRIALREYLVFTAAMRDELSICASSYNALGKLFPMLQDMVQKYGQPLLTDARKKFESGLISEESLREIERECLTRDASYEEDPKNVLKAQKFGSSLFGEDAGCRRRRRYSPFQNNKVKSSFHPCALSKKFPQRHKKQRGCNVA